VNSRTVAREFPARGRRKPGNPLDSPGFFAFRGAKVPGMVIAFSAAGRVVVERL
jgi:hypothetical protein